MVKTNFLSASISRAAVASVVVLLCSCGGGGGGSTPESAIGTVAAAPSTQDVAVQSAPNSGSAVAVPQPPDMSVAPPPGTDPTGAVPGPQMSASLASANTSVMMASTVVTGIPETTELPDGATACQPGICPAFAANGSVTNTLGADDPTAAHAYLLAASGASSGAYPDLGNLPTVILPPVPVTVTEEPDPATEQAL